MRHVQDAISRMEDNPLRQFIEIENPLDEPTVAPVVKFTIQSAPVGYCESEGGIPLGINGCQARDMLEYVKCLFQSFNDKFPCRENSITITKLEEAIHWQDHRTADREKRNDKV